MTTLPIPKRIAAAIERGMEQHPDWAQCRQELFEKPSCKACAIGFALIGEYGLAAALGKGEDFPPNNSRYYSELFGLPGVSETLDRVWRWNDLHYYSLREIVQKLRELPDDTT